MVKKNELNGSNSILKRAGRSALALALTIGLVGLPARAQNDQNQAPPPPPPPGADNSYGGPEQGGPPPGAYGYPQGGGYQQQGGYPPQGYPQQRDYPRQGGYPQGAPPADAAPQQPVPPTFILPAGLIIPVRVSQWLSSDRNHSGDTFNATLEQPLLANGWVVARRGQPIVGTVEIAEKAGHGKSDSHLGLALNELVLVNGQQVPLTSELVQAASGRPTGGQRAGTVAATTIIGAAIGAVAGGGTGAAIGAGVGAGAGLAGVMATRGRPTVVGPETLLSFRLTQSIEVSTQGSEAAFQPVSDRDFARGQDAYRRPRPYGPGYGPGYPAPPPYPYPAYYAPYPYPYYYPGPAFFGFGFGPRFHRYGRW